jgi:hypothetical protein
LGFATNNKNNKRRWYFCVLLKLLIWNQYRNIILDEKFPSYKLVIRISSIDDIC